MESVKKHLATQAKFATDRAERAERDAAAFSKSAAESIAEASEHRKQAAEFSRLAAEQAE